MEIRSRFTGVDISEASADALSRFASNPAPLLELGNKVYPLNGDEWRGYILGGLMLITEDDRDFFADSMLLSSSVEGLLQNS